MAGQEYFRIGGSSQRPGPLPSNNENYGPRRYESHNEQNYGQQWLPNRGPDYHTPRMGPAEHELQQYPLTPPPLNVQQIPSYLNYGQPPPRPFETASVGSEGVTENQPSYAPSSRNEDIRPLHSAAQVDVEANMIDRETLLNTNPRIPLKGHRNFFHPKAKHSWEFPHSFRLPDRKYDDTMSHRHRDAMRRIWKGFQDDRYLRSSDARVVDLVVQTTDDIYDGPANCTWRRTYVRNVSAFIVRLAQWPVRNVPRDPKQWDRRAWVTVGLWWLPVCTALLIVMFFPTDVEGPVVNNGFYTAFPYRYWGYLKAARNSSENSKTRIRDTCEDNLKPLADRPLRPRYLCFLQNYEDKEFRGLETKPSRNDSKSYPVEEWLSAKGADTSIDYLFVSYTNKQFDYKKPEELEALHRIAEKATRDAGLRAYWIDTDCMPSPENVDFKEDVYRINDVVRNAHAVAIIVGPSTPQERTRPSMQQMLQVWGRRLWTFPEVLLTRPGKRILVYAQGICEDKPRKLYRLDLAAIAWKDVPLSRQLVDHYENTLKLSRLELVVLALKCLSNRETKQFYPGDLSYALMGLLRQRPKIDPTDSAFQAFARLSLVNGSDMLLERLICVLPSHPSLDWSDMKDAWNVSLWDIYPTCQVAGIGHDDTVLIDGAFGAAIRWDSFDRVAVTTKETWTRLIARLLLRGSPVWLIVGASLAAAGKGQSTLTGFGAIFLILALATILTSPILVHHCYGGKFWSTQPWLFGFEGYLDIETIETNIFGFPQSRLTWSPFASPLSVHRKNQYLECIGVDPMSEMRTRETILNARNGKHGDSKIFTLVDTNTMTVTMFEAKQPPVALVICGAEGGMQRAVLCSYDWKTQILFRETVLRMETVVLEKMSRMGRFRFGFKRPDVPTIPVES